MISGFIGAGNMGGALAQAVSTKSEVYLSDQDSVKVNALAEKINAKVSDNAEIAEKAKYIFLGVKPQVLSQAVGEIKDILSGRQSDYIIVTMAAGVEVERLESLLGFRCPIIRIMPNTPVAVGSGMILYTANDLVSDFDEFKTILENAGKLDMLGEGLIDAASAVSGCGPAFVYMFAQSLADGAVKCGLPRDKAIEYAAQTILGSAKMILECGKHPIELKDAVCSPGGTTIAGVHALEHGALGAVVMDAVEAAYKRTKELGK